MSVTRAACALAICSIGCSADYPRPQHATPPASTTDAGGQVQLTESARRLQLLLQQLGTLSTDPDTRDALRVVGMQPGPVPGFELLAAGGEPYSSRELIGKRPFVAVFFATWCDYCEGELKAVAQAFHESGAIPVIPVSADGPETWPRVSAYLARFGIREPAVRATDYPLFSASYNPMDVLPSLVVVGKDGTLVDYLHGYDPAHAARLASSLRTAKTTGPLTLPRLTQR